ncbi:MAG: chromate efflux transporter [Beijerinckiaceae bacterium]|nr:chromate efflux transporter [Beijerinckiaceae bacterium]
MTEGLQDKALEQPSIGEWLAMSFRIGCLSFGGAAGQIAMMHRLLVEERRWVSERDFLDGLNFCTLLPGPEAQQLATWLGWRLHGIRGGLISGILFVLPGALLILALAQLYVRGAGLPAVEGLLLGIKAAVIAIILEALIRLSRKALGSTAFRALALVAFLAMAFTTLPFPAIIGVAALAGSLLARGRTPGPAPAAAPAGFSWRVAGLTFGMWWLPVGAAALILGGQHLLVEIGLFFSKLAVITFGGAYALLAYLVEEGVRRGWASPGEMLDALGLAETTPGPTILVNPFIAFLGGFKSAGSLMGWLAGLMALWVTFAPSFLWIFAGGPYIERINRNPRLAGALKGIGAAVVGIIASVALKFGTLFLVPGSIRWEAGWLSAIVPAGMPDGKALILSALALGLTFAYPVPLVRRLMVVMISGLALRLVA